MVTARRPLCTIGRAMCAAVLLIAWGIVAAPSAAQPAFPVGRPLSGTIVCRVETTGATTNQGYTETQIHTWTLTGGTPQVPNGQLWIHPAQWSVTGKGRTDWRVQNYYQYDNWTIAVTPREAPIAIRSRASDNRLVVELWHSPSQAADALTGAIEYWGGGANNTPQPYKEPLAEAPLSPIEADRSAASLSGSSTATLTGNFPTHRQSEATNVQVRETCTWSIAPVPSAAPPPPPSGSESSNTTSLETATIAIDPGIGASARANASAPPPTAPPPANTITPSPTIALSRSPADGPWSGQAQCVIVTSGPSYQEEQTHTWRITGATPEIGGSMRRFPAVWSARGSGSRSVVVATGSQKTTEERWTISVPETSAPISVWEIPGYRGNNRIRIGSQHGLLVANNAIRPSTGSIAYSIQEWLFPAAEDEFTKTTLSGAKTSTVPFGPAWRRPDKVPSTVTCTWHFTRADVDLSSRSTPPAPAPATAVLANPNAPRATVAPPTASSTVPAAPQVNQPTPVTAPSAGVRAPTAGIAAIAGGTGGTGAVLGAVKECSTTGPVVTASSITPGGVTLKWPQFSGATGYSIARKDIGVITATPVTALTYTHSAPLDHQNPPYVYSVTAFQANGACATTNLTVTAPRPITPTVTPTVTPGAQASRVNLKWGDQTDIPSGYLVLGAGLHENGAEIQASRSGQAMNIDNLPAGEHTWLVLPFWRTSAGTISDVSLAARVTATVGVTSGRYRIFIAGFRANNQTSDDPLNRDGWLDEIYAAAAVVKWENGAVKSNEVIKSLVYGDANSSDRVRAGSGSGNGGIKAGDLVPAGWSPTSAQLPPEASSGRFPLKIWEGTLHNSDIVSVRPTLWEFDGDSGAYLYWRAWALSQPSNGGSDPGLVVTKGARSPLYQFVTGAQYENHSELLDDLFSSNVIVDFRRFDDGMKKTAARFFPGKDRIVGLDGYQQDRIGLWQVGDAKSDEFDFSKIYWVDRQIAFTRQKIEAALTAPGSGGLAPGMIALSLVDEDHSPAGPLHGDYTLYLQVQRMP
jgi:hypothetical protein